MRAGRRLGDRRNLWAAAISLTGLLLFAVLVPKPAYAINCRVTLVAMSFGIYMPMTPTDLDASGQVEVRCQAQAGTFSVIIGPGISGDQTARTLTSANGDLLFYNLYRNAARTEIWGDGSPPTYAVSGVRTGQGRPSFYNYVVYGRIFANQAPNPGAYSDNLVVTVLF